MIEYEALEVWFVTGSQHLYGPETLERVRANTARVVEGLNAVGHVPIRVVAKPTLTTAEEVTRTLTDASSTPACIGVIAWMHTFSPAKMWIAGLERLNKPLCHLHTQSERDIPWPVIDMAYMNLHQSAHGDREFGHICERLGLRRKVIAGHWQSPDPQRKLGTWMRAAAAWHASQNLKVARFGDNMRGVAVTEGDKVAAQRVFGYAVEGFGIGELAGRVDAVSDGEAADLCAVYEHEYDLAEGLRSGAPERRSLVEAARIELGLRSFLREGGFSAFTDTFEDLAGLKQLPGIAAQRLMADGYGFGAEGDWKHAALVYQMKVMARGLPGGTSFMEDYTYHLDPEAPAVLGAHMLEICPSIASATPSCQVHPLDIGSREDPVRLVFDGAEGPAVNATVVDLGDRFRMVVNRVNAIEPPEDLPRLPVARVLWRPEPDLTTSAEAWIYAGGAHHTGFSHALTAEHLRDFASIAGVEFLDIADGTTVPGFCNELRWNQAAFASTPRL
ncbi:MAG: L-arabinose isomerase [Planctomycetota bacterium]